MLDHNHVSHYQRALTMEDARDHRMMVENKNLIVMEYYYCNDYYVVVNRMVVDLMMMMAWWVVGEEMAVVADDHMDEKVMEVFDPYLNVNESLKNKMN